MSFKVFTKATRESRNHKNDECRLMLQALKPGYYAVIDMPASNVRYYARKLGYRVRAIDLEGGKAEVRLKP